RRCRARGLGRDVHVDVEGADRLRPRTGAHGDDSARRAGCPGTTELSAETAFPLLFRPVELGPATLANRLVRSAHGTGLGQPAIGDDLVAYTESAAADGFGLIILEDAAPHRSSPPAAGILAWDDDVIAGYERLAAAVEPHGTMLFQQLMHSGGYRPREDGGAPWAPSAIPYVGYAGLPLELTQAMID